MKTEKHKKAALRRKRHVATKVAGTRERPRLSVYRSNRQIYAQIVDDTAGVTLVAMSTKSKDVSEHTACGGNKKAAEAVGEALAKRAQDVGIKCVRFDRNRYRYHGRVKSLADAARKAGLAF